MRFAKNPWPTSLRGRLLGVFVLGLAASATLVALVFLLAREPFHRHLMVDRAQYYAHEIAEHIRFDAQGQPVGFDDQLAEPWLFNGLGREVVLRVLQPDGRVALTLDGDPAPSALAPEGEGFDPARRSFTTRRDGVEMHVGTVPLERGGRTWLMQFAFTDRLWLRMQRSFGGPAVQDALLALCAVFLIVFCVTTHFTLRHALRPLRQASGAARRISPRSLDHRLDEALQPQEIRPLVQAFNQALDRLERGFRTQQEFLASAAHELKTPLALIRAQVELGPAGPSRGQLLEDVDRVARQVQQLLLLAEASEPQNYRIERIDPRPALQEVFDFMERVAERRQVHLGIRVDPALKTWEADRGGLFTLLKNLLENAIQHSPTGGAVWLTAGLTGFSVADQGKGVAPEHLPRIFDRFWRGADRRDDGAGLGLSICTEIATAHGWTLSAAPGAVGLVVRCEFAATAVPAAADPEPTTTPALPNARAPRPLGHVLRDVFF